MNRSVQHAQLTAPQPVGATAPVLSIVIPMRDEAASVAPLLNRCVAAMAGIGPFEICVTDDGSRDGTAEALRDYAARHQTTALTVVTLTRSAGQSAALHEAVLHSRAPIICTLDGDGQNPPEEIGRVIAPLIAPGASTGLGLVAGQRRKRRDSASKRLASAIANRIRSAVLRDGTRDTGCGLKAFRREAYLALPYFDHMHRFLPALFRRDGWEVALVDVAHAPRLSGRSKYSNLQRALVGVTDLIGVAWLIRRRKRIAPPGRSVTRSDAAPR
ncbi:dolichol-phosphate mannosyltransferase [Paracoccus isoporae]|uniref:Dolichol-phosphate mannosyltransferase n=1 Tax=Paracoccus isoporae TaxID=591205 RepID=A0A1G6ZG99_9RHOB|nr:dolichol-phosphate mannosyltransferase [Paracoccus isoporae]